MKKRIFSLICALAILICAFCVPMGADAEDKPVYRVGETVSVDEDLVFGGKADNVTEWAILDKFFDAGSDCVDVSDIRNWKMIAEGEVSLRLSVWYTDTSSKMHLESRSVIFDVKGSVQTISEISLTGIPVPQEGETPLRDAESVKCGGNTYSVLSVVWSDDTDNNDDLHSAFTAGGKYTVHITLAPSAGSVFADKPAARVNGAAATVARGAQDAAYVVVSQSFTAKAATAQAVIDRTVGDISAPAGTKAFLGVDARASIPGAELIYSWQLDDGSGFMDITSEDRQYMTVTVGEGEAQKYRCAVTAVKNGVRNVAYSDPITVTAAEFSGQVSAIELENVTSPEFGSAISCFASLSSDGAVISDIKWFTSHGRDSAPEKYTYLDDGAQFGGETFYGVCITLSGGFAGEVTAKVNGNPARTSLTEDGDLLVYYIFKKLERVFVRQPADKTITPGASAYASWETNFVPVKAEIIDISTGETVHTSSRPAAEQAVPAVWYAEQGKEYKLCARLFFGSGKDDYIQSDTFVYTVASAPTYEPDYIAISGVTAPERKATPGSEFTLPVDVGYTVKCLGWLEVGPDGGEQLQDVFKADGSQYMVCFSAYPGNGSAFPSDCAASVNGYGAFTGVCGDKLIIVYNFGAVEPDIEEESSAEPASEEESAAEPASEEESSVEPVSEEESSAEPASEEESYAEPASEEESVAEPVSEEESVAEPESEEESVAEPASEEESVAEPASEEESVAEPASEEESVAEPTSEEESVDEPASEEQSVPAPAPAYLTETEPFAWWIIPITLVAICAVVFGTWFYLKKRR